MSAATPARSQCAAPVALIATTLTHWANWPVRRFQRWWYASRLACIDDEIASYHRTEGPGSATTAIALIERAYAVGRLRALGVQL